MEVKLDQHFLENLKILDLEVEICDIKNEDIILEIGPGDCRLTKLVLEKSPKKLIAIEKDLDLENNLLELKNKNSNFTYIIGNGLDEIKNLKFDKLISNIPYSITEPLYKYLMNNKVKFVVILHGEKFYNQILSKKSKWYFFINSFYNIKLISEIKGDNFKPIAKVKSVLLKLELKDENKLTKKDKFFQSLFFRQGRNTKNALIYSLVEIGFNKKESKEIINKNFEELNLENRIIENKLENITNKSFIKIIEKIFEYLQ